MSFRSTLRPRPCRRRLSARVACALLAVLLAASTVLTWAPALASADESASATAAASSSTSNIRELSIEERDELYSHARLGAISGSITELELAKQYPDADLELFASESDVLAALVGNKIDYAFVTEFFANRYMETAKGYEYITPVFISFDDCFGIAKGNDELREKIDAVLSRMREDGTLDAINKKWVVDRDYSMDDVPACDTGETVLRVVTTGADEPYTFIQNGSHAGVACEVIQRVASELGMRVEYQDTSFSSEIAALVSGKADVATQLAVTEERKEQIDFSAVYVARGYGALAKQEGAATSGFFDDLADNFTTAFITENRWQLVVAGLEATCLIAVGGFVLGSVLAAGLCWLSRRKNPAARAFARFYSKLVTGIPVLVWLMILYYVVFAAVDIPAVAVAVLCFGLQMAAGIAGVYDTGLKAVDHGQVEAGLAMGFSHAETFRRIVLPQAAARVWSLYSGQFTDLVKATSVVGYIAVQDLTKASDIIRSRTFQAFFPLLATAVVYFAIIALCGWVFSRLGRLLDPKRRKPATILKGVHAR